MRARNLKPGFFKNEELAKLPPLTRILFEGLWCMADREGRMEDRPARIKAEILPYDECDIEAMLNALQNFSEPFIIRYEIDSRRYIQVVKSGAHFNPHPNEKHSEIPKCLKKLQQKVEALLPLDGALALNPLSLNPESPLIESPILNPSPAPASPDRVPYEEFLKAYNDFRGPLPEAKTLNDDRRTKMRIRWAKNPSLEYWKDVTRKLAESDLAQKWASLDWILANDKNHNKAMEGNYDNRRNGAQNATRTSPNVSHRSNDPEREKQYAG